MLIGLPHRALPDTNKSGLAGNKNGIGPDLHRQLFCYHHAADGRREVRILGSKGMESIFNLYGFRRVR